MKLEPVTSSNINAIGHDGNTMWVDFKKSGLYYYENVPSEVHASIMQSDSKGSALNQLGLKGKKF